MILIEFIIKKLYKFKALYKNEKIRFLIYGSFNTLITNLILQFFLLISSVFISTFISQVTNLLLGFYLYGSRVFNVNVFSKNKFLLYSFLAFISWQLNYFLIIFLSNKIGLSNNFSAILVLPILSIWSYLIQKIIIFKKLKNNL